MMNFSLKLVRKRFIFLPPKSITAHHLTRFLSMNHSEVCHIRLRIPGTRIDEMNVEMKCSVADIVIRKYNAIVIPNLVMGGERTFGRSLLPLCMQGHKRYKSN